VAVPSAAAPAARAGEWHDWKDPFVTAKDTWEIDASTLRGKFWLSSKDLFFEWHQREGTLFQYFPGEEEPHPIWSSACPDTHKEVWEELPLPPTDPAAAAKPEAPEPAAAATCAEPSSVEEVERPPASAALPAEELRQSLPGLNSAATFVEHARVQRRIQALEKLGVVAESAVQPAAAAPQPSPVASWVALTAVKAASFGALWIAALGALPSALVVEARLLWPLGGLGGLLTEDGTGGLLIGPFVALAVADIARRRMTREAAYWARRKAD